MYGKILYQIKLGEKPEKSEKSLEKSEKSHEKSEKSFEKSEKSPEKKSAADVFSIKYCIQKSP